MHPGFRFFEAVAIQGSTRGESHEYSYICIQYICMYILCIWIDTRAHISMYIYIYVRMIYVRSKVS